MNKYYTSTLNLTSRTAVSLWNNELTGQISDGMWENTYPYDHWEFWCKTKAVYHPTDNNLVTNESYKIRKNNYGFIRLIPYVGYRMLEDGRKINSSYTLKNLKDDMKLIKQAMHNIVLKESKF